jgi:hypothetical protein
MSNLLEKTSILLTPTAYEDGGVLSIKPSDGTGDFSFSRGSVGTRINEQGFVENVQILSGELVQNGDFEQIGSELVTNGSFDTDSDWSKGANTTIENGFLNFADASSNTDQSLSTTNAKIYKVVYSISNYSTGSVRFRFTGTANVNGINRNANGTYTEYIKATSDNSIFRFAANSFTGSIDNVSVKEVGQNWTFGTSWSMGDGVAISDGTSSYLTDSVSSGFISGKKYRVSLEILEYNSGRVSLPFDGAGANINYQDSVGVKTTDIIAQNNSPIYIYSNVFDGTIDNVSVIEVTDDTDLPRINYTDGEGSLLLEPQSTNLVTYSEDFSDSSWNTARIETPYIANVVSPDGTLNAYTLEISSGETNGGGVYKTGISIAGDNSYSVFAKKKTADYLVISDTSTTGYAVYFNLENGTVGTEYNATGQIEYFGNGWYRCTMKYNLISSGFKFLYVSNIDGQTTNGVQGGDSIYLWGAQLEELSYATSYIPTNGSTVTRLADVCNNSGNSDLINSTEGVLYAEIMKVQTEPDHYRLISLNNDASNSDANSVTLGFNNNTDDFYVRVKANNINILQNYQISSNANQFYKIAVKYKSGDCALWIDGVEQDTSTTTFAFTQTLDNLSFDYNGNGILPFYGNVKCVAVFKEALSDTELTCLTS